MSTVEIIAERSCHGDEHEIALHLLEGTLGVGMVLRRGNTSLLVSSFGLFCSPESYASGTRLVTVTGLHGAAEIAPGSHWLVEEASSAAG